MPKTKGDWLKRTSATSSEAAKDRPVRPTGKRLKANRRPYARCDDPQKPKPTLDLDGLEIVEVEERVTISLLTQQQITPDESGPSTSKAGTETITVHGLSIAHNAESTNSSTQELKKTASGTSESSQMYWETLKGWNSDDLENLDSPHLSCPTSNSSASTPSLVNSASSSMDSSPSVLGKRKATDAPGPSKATKHGTSFNDVENPLGPSYVTLAEAPRQDERLSEGVVIASDRSFEKMLETKQIPFMARYEIARLHSIGKIRYGDIRIDTLDGLSNMTNAKAAPITQDTVTQRREPPQPEPTQFGAAVEDERAAKSPWAEFDTEIKERSRDPDAALGCSEVSSYYGGKVYFLAKLKYNKGTVKDKWKIVLDKPALGPSNRFARKFGSHSFLRVSVKAAKKDLRSSDSDCLLDFFRRPFFLMDRVYRACFAKDNTVMLFLTNETICDEKAQPPPANYKPGYFDGKYSLLDFINWHNPLAFNSKQAAAKWAARFALGFSNSVPALKLKPEQIEDIDDVPSSEWNGSGKLPAEHDMTDGNGLANCVLLQQVRSRIELEEFPSVIQCRLGGAKGTLALHSSGRFDDSQTVPKAYKRPSQDKIKYDPDKPLDPAMLIVDLLKPSHMQTPSRLSTETIINLAENGVPTSVFVNLMKAAMCELSNALTTWEGPDAMYALFANVAKIGGVIAARIARELGGESRARGYGDRNDDDDDDEEPELSGADEELLESSLAWYADLISGQPSSLEETVMGLLASAFEPDKCAVLAEKLEKIHTAQLANLVSKFKITVPMSCSAMVIPDPCDPPVLKEGEVHIKIDRTSGKLNGCSTEDVVRGEVLVTRHPCKLPNDVQKVVAIEHPDLRHVTNCIVFPRVGKRSPASLLGGGDYDGDTVIAIWQPEIVNKFNPQPKANSYADPPPDLLEKNFSKKSQTIQELLAEISIVDDDDNKLMLELQNYLLGSLKDDSLVGTYSNMHEVAVYEKGYYSDEAKRLAHMFMVIMDAQKSGLSLNQAVRKEDHRRWGNRQLPYKSGPRTEEGRIDMSNGPSSKRKGGGFILDDLKRRGRDIEGELRRSFERKKQGCVPLDVDLEAPFREADRRAKRIFDETGCRFAIEELERIKAHVVSSRINHRDKLSELNVPRSPSKNGSAFTGRPITERQDIIRDLSRRHVLFPPPDQECLFLSRAELCRVRASYSYYHDWEISDKRFTRFPWDVDYRWLCTIKAAAQKFEKTVCRNFYDRLNILPKYRTYRT